MVTPDLSIPAPLSKVDVIVVGGGPVGLLAANLIVQAGMSVRIFGTHLFSTIYVHILKLQNRH